MSKRCYWSYCKHNRLETQWDGTHLLWFVQLLVPLGSGTSLGHFCHTNHELQKHAFCPKPEAKLINVPGEGMMILSKCADWGSATARTAAGTWSTLVLLPAAVRHYWPQGSRCRLLWWINSDINGDHKMYIVHIWNCIFRWFVFSWAIQLISTEELIYGVYPKWWVQGRRQGVVF